MPDYPPSPRQSTRRRVPDSTCIILCTLLLLAPSACVSPYPLLQGTPVEQPLTVVDTRGAVLLRDATAATWPADFARLPDDLARTFRDLGWGKMRLEVVRTPESPAAAPAGSQSAPAVGQPARTIPDGIDPVQAVGLAADGKIVDVLAWALPDREGVSVAVRIGHFGSPRQERDFLAVLGRHLAGEPRPTRHQSFFLPD